MRLAVIPARSGSKRIPRKNVKPFFGKPIMAWAIESAIQSKCFDRIIISTDDAEIADIARQHGAEAPFIRPAELADDHTGTIAVIAHAVEWQMKQGLSPDAVCCIYPTAAFLQAEYLQRGLEALEQTGSDYAISVTSYAYPVQRAIRLTSDQRIEMLQPAHVNTRSQDLDPIYHDAAQFYWGRPDAWLNNRPLLTSDTTPVILPNYLTQDIDTIEDWVHAEFKFARYIEWHRKENTP